MTERTLPETPQDLQHPGRLATDAAAKEAEAAEAEAASRLRLQTMSVPDEDDTPIFDDPIIGWWENAWSLREDQATPL